MRIGFALRGLVTAVIVGGVTLAAVQPPASAAPWDGIRAWETARVVRIVDGDTMLVSDLVTGAESRIRLIGINAPEIQTKSKPGQCGWWQATNALLELAPPGTVVRLASVDQAWTGTKNGSIQAGHKRSYLHKSARCLT